MHLYALELYSQNSSLTFDGVDDHVHVNDNASLDLSTSGTLECWIKVTSFNNYAGIIHKGDVSNGSDLAYTLKFGTNANAQKIQLILNSSGTPNTLTSNVTLSTGVWYHIAGVWNSTTIYLYINGALDASMTRTKTPQNSSGGLNIGSCYANGSSPYNGKIDEVRIWSVERTLTQIQNNMYSQLAGNESGLVLYYDFEEASGTRTEAHISQSVSSIVLTSSGSGYTSFPGITISGGGGTGATASVTNMEVTGSSIVNGGSGYRANSPALDIVGGTATTNAVLSITSVSGGTVTGVSIQTPGVYSVLPSNPVSTTNRYGTGATFNLTWSVYTLSLTNAGSGYVSSPVVTFNSGNATATAYLTLTGVFYNGSTSGSGPVWNTENSPVYHEWLGTTSTSWSTTTNWFGGWLPNNNIPVKISSTASNNCVLGVDTQCGTLLIESGKSLTINPSFTLKANGTTQINGSLILETNSSNSGSFIDNGTINYSSGTVTFKRILANSKWHYISSPVNSSTANVFWNCAVYRYYEPDGGTSNAWKPIVAGNTLSNMQGYDVYVKSTDKTVSFTGSLNTGTYTNNTLTRSYDGYNFIGNPYPSAIDWDAASGWTKTYLDGAIYIWDPNTGNFMTYANGSGTNGGSRYIPATQGFFVKVSSGYTSGVLSMNNSVRVTNSVAYRNEKSIPEIKLLLKSPNFKDETVIRFSNQASEEFDGCFDAMKIFPDNLSGSPIYTSDNKLNYSINTLPEFSQNFEIPVSINAHLNETDTLVLLNALEGKNYNIFLEDKETGEFINFKENPQYVFSAVIGSGKSRFILHISEVPLIKDTTVSVIENKIQTVDARFINGKIVIVNTDKSTNPILKIAVYTADGKQIGLFKNTDELEKLEMRNTQFVFVRIMTKNSIQSIKLLMKD